MHTSGPKYEIYFLLISSELNNRNASLKKKKEMKYIPFLNFAPNYKEKVPVYKQG